MCPGIELEDDFCICEVTRSLYILSGDGKDEAPVCSCLLTIQFVMCHEIADIAASSDNSSYSPTKFVDGSLIYKCQTKKKK